MWVLNCINQSAASSLLPGLRRAADHLQHWRPWLAVQHHPEVVARGEALLPEHSHRSGGQQGRPAHRPDDAGRAGQDEAAAGQYGAGTGHGRAHRRLQVPRVLGKNQGRRAYRFRDGHSSRSGSQAIQAQRLLCHSLGTHTHTHTHTHRLAGYFLLGQPTWVQSIFLLFDLPLFRALSIHWPLTLVHPQHPCISLPFSCSPFLSFSLSLSLSFFLFFSASFFLSQNIFPYWPSTRTVHKQTRQTPRQTETDTSDHKNKQTNKPVLALGNYCTRNFRQKNTSFQRIGLFVWLVIFLFLLILLLLFFLLLLISAHLLLQSG